MVKNSEVENYLPLSVVILSLNEEVRIGKAVSSVASFCGQLIVMDSYSTDRTLAVVQSEWKKNGRLDQDLVLISQVWRGFTQTRNDSLEWAGCPWIFWLDADEWVDTEKFKLWFKSVIEDESVLKKPSVVFKFPRKSIYMGHWVRFGGWSPDYKNRLSKKQGAEWKKGSRSADVHEDLLALDNSSPLKAKTFIYHFPFQNKSEHIETNRRYSRIMGLALAQEKMKMNQRPPTRFFIFVKSVFKFIENYFFKLGFLDLKVGLIIAYYSALSMKWRLEVARETMLLEQKDIKK
jgi:glycosyltransferase involved in cell wall biosynthesis